MLASFLSGRREIFAGLCRSHRVGRLYAFGSLVNGGFSDKSDIDLLVEVEPGGSLETGERLWSFLARMEEFFGRRVDLLTPGSVKNPARIRSIERSKKPVYDGAAGGLLSSYRARH